MSVRGPLVYWSLPVGLALILGIIWTRRKKPVQSDDKPANVTPSSDVDAVQPPRVAPSLQHSVSMPITAGSNSTSSVSPTDGKLGKSAPIDINPNRITPVKLTNQQIDREILKVPVLPEEPADDDAMLSDDDSLCALSDSGDRRRRRFSFNRQRTVKEGNPIVIKATKPAKISPEHSFVESKYATLADTNGNDTNVVPNKEPVQAPKADSANQKPLAADSNNAKETADNDCKHSQLSNINALAKTNMGSPTSSLSSVQSKDSGKGSTPPRFDEPLISYEFIVRPEVIGPLLGRKGQFVREIKKTCKANIIIKLHPYLDTLKVACIEGTQTQIDEALKILRSRLTPKRFPGLTFKQVFLPTRPEVAPRSRVIAPLNPVKLQISLNLIEGINNDVTISTIIDGGHMFLQQPVHPSFLSLATLHRCMNNTYTFCKSVPLEEEQLVRDAVCVVKFEKYWYRVQIGNRQEGATECVVKFLDYGGYASVSVADLRQIRGDFLTVPFQAIECVLANVRTVDGQELQSVQVLQDLTRGKTLQAQVAGYTDEGVPEVLLYVQLTPNRVVYINGELVARKLSEWVDNDGQV